MQQSSKLRNRLVLMVSREIDEWQRAPSKNIPCFCGSAFTVLTLHSKTAHSVSIALLVVLGSRSERREIVLVSEADIVIAEIPGIAKVSV